MVDSNHPSPKVSKRLRYEILRRDNHTCRYCGDSAPDVKLTVDHVTPTALGGVADPGNLVTACADCNAGKSSSSPDAALVADVEQDALRWSRALQHVLSVRAEDADARDEYVQDFHSSWCLWWHGGTRGQGGENFPLPPDWRSTLERFYELELPSEDMLRAVNRACENNKIRVGDTFRYFCGVCWRMLDEIQQATRDVLRAEDA